MQEPFVRTCREFCSWGIIGLTKGFSRLHWYKVGAHKFFRMLRMPFVAVLVYEILEYCGNICSALSEAGTRKRNPRTLRSLSD